MSLLISCSMMLAGAAMAQQPDEQGSPKEKKQGHEKAHAAEAKPRANMANPQAPVVKQRAEVKERAVEKTPNVEATQKVEAKRNEKKAAHAETNVTAQPAAIATPIAKQHAEKHNKAIKAPDTNAKVAATPALKVAATPAPTAAATAAPAAAAASQQKMRTGTARPNTAAATKKPAPQKVKEIKAEHANFHAQAKPQQVPTVTFSQNYRIQGSDQWQGEQYERFRSYHPERHDRDWYHSRYHRVERIGGGYYYWNEGYWYPAWGYDSSNEYYAYDAPIYVGHTAEPPDRVIADVQAQLQEMGYYKGEVDGLLGPMTREALTGYQADEGLTPTAMIDEPTLDSLGMGS